MTKIENELTTQKIYEKSIGTLKKLSKSIFGSEDIYNLIDNVEIFDSVAHTTIYVRNFKNEELIEKICRYVYNMYYALHLDYCIDDIVSLLDNKYQEGIDIDTILSTSATDLENELYHD